MIPWLEGGALLDLLGGPSCVKRPKNVTLKHDSFFTECIRNINIIMKGYRHNRRIKRESHGPPIPLPQKWTYGDCLGRIKKVNFMSMLNYLNIQNLMFQNPFLSVNVKSKSFINNLWVSLPVLLLTWGTSKFESPQTEDRERFPTTVRDIRGTISSLVLF